MAPLHPNLVQLRKQTSQAHREKDPSALGKYAAYLAQVPQDGAMWSNLGALHRSEGRYEKALWAQERAHALAPDDVGMRNNYANILSDLGFYDDSIAARRWILGHEPDDANQKAMIGRCLRGKGDYAAAIAHLEKAILQHPEDTELKMQLAFAQLGAGDYAQGFDTYRVRWQAGELKPRTIKHPEWNGEPLEGKTILVLPEQGFGDAIAFARFLPALKALGGRVMFLTEKPVAPLFEGLAGADWVGTQVPKDTKIDYWINAMDMARVHFAVSSDVPPPPKLHIPQTSKDRAARMVAPHEGKMKVGVVWTGSVTYKGNGFRSFSHRDYYPLINIPDVQLFSLYKGPKLAEFHADGSDGFIIDAASTEQSFGDSAAMMEEMDLVITSDTATAHLAGCLTTPTWVALHWDPFWLWRHSGDTTIWYPKMKLFRQAKALAWGPVMAEIADELLIKQEQNNE